MLRTRTTKAVGSACQIVLLVLLLVRSNGRICYIQQPTNTRPRNFFCPHFKLHDKLVFHKPNK
uniref:Hypothetical secreted peptide 1057 n=1 Tax=Amblyomma variegatum TaxID=34610 RepID=F0J9S3_AMBVA|nr:TPA_inf: hypothetical secreted peptide precursor 1057 [Amblyomma variegatum]